MAMLVIKALENFRQLDNFRVDGNSIAMVMPTVRDLTPFAKIIAELEKQRLEEYIAISEEQELDGNVKNRQCKTEYAQTGRR